MALVAEPQGPRDRRARDPRRRPPEQAPRHQRGRVRPARQRPLPGPGPGHRAAPPPVQVGRDEKLDRIIGDILPENLEMQRICEKLNFKMTHNIKESVIRAVTDL